MFVFLLPTFSASAQVNAGIEYGDNIGLGKANPVTIVIRIIQFFLGFLALIAVILVIYAGYLWMTAGGDPSKVEKAKQILKNALIGLVIILSAFGIVSWIFNLFDKGNGPNNQGSGGGGGGSGIGGIGSCIIQSVYPAPYQKNVPMNTAIVVTFRQPIDPSTVCESSCNGSDEVKEGVVRIFKRSQESDCTDSDGCPADYVKAWGKASADKKTFVFYPQSYLGNFSENIDYMVYLEPTIKRTDGQSAFDPMQNACKFAKWYFEVSKDLDLTPPQILESGLIPAPDNEADEVDASAAAVQAKGRLSVLDEPKEAKAAKASGSANAGNPVQLSKVEIDPNCSEDTIVKVLMEKQDDKYSAKASKSSDTIALGKAELGSDQKTISFEYCDLTLTTASAWTACGASDCLWNIDMTPAVAADSLVVADNKYLFGKDIKVDPDPDILAGNIAKAINDNNSKVSASASGADVAITARLASAAGNNYSLISSNESAVKVSQKMSGGSDSKEKIIINGGRKDKPRNSVIQIRFNEAVNPLNVSGNASDIKNYIRVVNMDTGEALEGTFTVSNQYSTVEFLSNVKCGVNACNQDIYCLPEKSHLKVVLTAANLKQCNSDDNCKTFAEYKKCNTAKKVCYNDSTDINYPQASMDMDGVLDMANNSLDGNRNKNAEGQTVLAVNIYDENEIYGICEAGTNKSGACTQKNKVAVCGSGVDCDGAADLESAQGNGDSFTWSFFISDRLEIGSPLIGSIKQELNSLDIDLEPNSQDADTRAPFNFYFDKPMMSASLISGESSVKTAKGENLSHKHMNLWSYNPSELLGYWITSTNIDNDPPDNETDSTRAELNHSSLNMYTSYRNQAGAGLKDIYQNCYKPGHGPGCDYAGDPADHPSCCNGQKEAAASCP